MRSTSCFLFLLYPGFSTGRVRIRCTVYPTLPSTPDFAIAIMVSPCQGWPQAGSWGEKCRGAGEQTVVDGQETTMGLSLGPLSRMGLVGWLPAWEGVSPGSFIGREFVISMKEKVSTASTLL